MFYLQRTLKENFWWLHSHNRLQRVWTLSYHSPHSRISRAENFFQVNKAFQARDFIKPKNYVWIMMCWQWTGKGLVYILLIFYFYYFFCLHLMKHKRGWRKMPFHRGWILNREGLRYSLDRPPVSFIKLPRSKTIQVARTSARIKVNTYTVSRWIQSDISSFLPTCVGTIAQTEFRIAYSFALSIPPLPSLRAESVHWLVLSKGIPHVRGHK